MSLRESLDSISATLDAIIRQLREETGKSTGVPTSSQPNSSGGNTKVSNSRGVFSTPPAPPGSHLRGVTNTTSTTSYMTVPDDPQRPGWGRAVAMTGAAAATAAYETTPGLDDVYPYQRLLFRAGFLSSGGYRHRRPGMTQADPGYWQSTQTQISLAFGDRMTDPYGALTAANILNMSGSGLGTAHFTTLMPQIANTSMLFNQSNATAAQAQGTLYGGGMAGRLAAIGIYVSDLQTGDPIKFGKIIDQIWARAYGSPTRVIPYESLMADLRGGFLGSWLRKTFADSPELYDQVYQALIIKANADSRRLDYTVLGKRDGQPGDITPSRREVAAANAAMPGGAARLGEPGVPAAIDYAESDLGLNVENDPALKRYELEGSRADNIQAYAQEILDAYRIGVDAATMLNDVTQWFADLDNPIFNTLLNLKGFLESVFSMGELSGPFKFLLSLFGGGLLPFNQGGGVHDQQIRRLNQGGPTVDDVLRIARTKIGAPYVVAADGPNAFDCSGFTEWVYETQLGVPLSEVSYTQVNEHTLVAKAESASDTVDLGLARPGDLLFFKTGVHQADPSGLGISHVGIYTGNQKMIHAYGPPLAEMDISNYVQKYPLRAITRILDDYGSPAGTTSDDSLEESAEPQSATSAYAGEPASSSSGTLSAVSRPTVFSMAGLGGGSSMALGLASSFSWLTPPSVVSAIGQAVSVVSASTAEQQKEESQSSTKSHPNPGSGKGEKWLYEYLASKGLRKLQLKIAWVLGMRESSGDPSLHSKDKYGGSWTSSGPPHYDVGLFQINNINLKTVQELFGGDMRQMLDLEKNYKMFLHLSKNFTALRPWAIENDGITFNWSMYSPLPSWYQITESNHKRLWKEYEDINVHNYSEGAFRTGDETARVHEGETILPALTAELFRDVMRSMGVRRNYADQSLNVTLILEEASDEEAEEFARSLHRLVDQGVRHSRFVERKSPALSGIGNKAVTGVSKKSVRKRPQVAAL